MTGAGNTTISGVIGTTIGTLTKTGAGTLILSGANTYTGATTVSGGTLSIGADDEPGHRARRGHGRPADDRRRHAAGDRDVHAQREPGRRPDGGAQRSSTDPGVTLTYDGVIGGDGHARQGRGRDAHALGGANTYTGSTTINAGTVSVAADAGLGTAPGVATPGHLTLNGGTLQATASFTLNGRRGIAMGAGGATFDTTGATNLTYAGIATGTGSLTKSGTGTFTLSGATVSAGAVTLSGGVLVGPTGSPFAVAGDWTNNTGHGRVHRRHRHGDASAGRPRRRSAAALDHVSPT